MVARRGKAEDGWPRGKHRRSGPYHDDWREKISTGMITARLNRCALGEDEMTANQLKAADILLRKTIPDLARTELTGKDGGAVEAITKIIIEAEDGRSDD